MSGFKEVEGRVAALALSEALEEFLTITGYKLGSKFDPISILVSKGRVATASTKASTSVVSTAACLTHAELVCRGGFDLLSRHKIFF